MRETFEEIGLKKERIENVKKYGTLIIPTGVIVEAYVGYVKNFSLETAVRETFEEIGLKKERIENVKKYGTLIIPTGVIVEAYVGYVKNFSLDELNVNEDEVERIILVPLDYFFENDPEIEYVTVENEPFYVNEKGEKIEFPAKKWGLPEEYTKPWRGRPRRMLFYLYGGDVIWGITGEIIYSVSRELRSY